MQISYVIYWHGFRIPRFNYYVKIPWCAKRKVHECEGLKHAAVVTPYPDRFHMVSPCMAAAYRVLSLSHFAAKNHELIELLVAFVSSGVLAHVTARK